MPTDIKELELGELMRPFSADAQAAVSELRSAQAKADASNRLVELAKELISRRREADEREKLTVDLSAREAKLKKNIAELERQEAEKKANLGNLSAIKQEVAEARAELHGLKTEIDEANAHIARGQEAQRVLASLSSH